MFKFYYKSIDFKVFLGSVSLLVFSTIIFRFIPNMNFRLIQILVDIKGNILGTIAASFFFNCLSQKNNFKNRIIHIGSASFGLIIYEYIQKYIPWQIFDINDIYGTLIGTFFGLLISFIIYIFQYNENRYIQGGRQSS